MSSTETQATNDGGVRPPPEENVGWRWLRAPAIFCDAYNVDIFADSNIVRFSFGEYTDGEHQPYFRAGIAMPLSDAKALVRSLSKLIERHEKQEIKQKAPPGTT